MCVCDVVYGLLMKRLVLCVLKCVVVWSGKLGCRGVVCGA